jgi:uncharacterized protein (TIGR02147 family)
MKRPDVFDYLDHHSFLKDWIVYLKEVKMIGMRTLATTAGVSAASLSLCLSEDRRWTLKLLGKLVPHLELKKPEQEALRLLFVIGTTDDPMERLASFDDLRRIPAYSEKQRDSSTVYLYLRHWLNVTIRELVQLADFQPNAKWIRERLRFMPTELEIERSLRFLLKEGYLKQGPEGHWLTPNPHLDCQEGVYRLSLGEYHRQVLQLAQRSIEEVPRELRLILGHTVALDVEHKKQAEAILKAALNEIQKLSGNQASPDELYQFEFIMIPLSQKGDAA